jgi:hypothetical protein
MPTLWFCVPAHGRAKLTRICLEQLRRTCDALAGCGVEASAVVVADDENIKTARGLGFATVRRNNDFLSAKFNDGIQLACDPKYNPRPADYVVPCGSDDWVDHRLFLTLPRPGVMVGFRRISFVREDGGEITSSFVGYRGGSGIRIYPRSLMGLCGYRPADEDRTRACDTSILVSVDRACKEKLGRDLQIVYGDLHDRQIVDWKSPREQINSYAGVKQYAKVVAADPFEALADVFPSESLDAMRALYGRRRQAVAA